MSDDEFMDHYAVRPNPLNAYGVCGLSVERHPNPGMGTDHDFLALTATPTEGVITHRSVPFLAAGTKWWHSEIRCSPAFVRSQVAAVERTGVWEQRIWGWNPPHMMMCHPNTYIVRLRDAERARRFYLYMPESTDEKPIRRMAKALISRLDRSLAGWERRIRWHSLFQHFVRGK